MENAVNKNLGRLNDVVETVQMDVLELQGAVERQAGRLQDCEETIQRLADALRNYRVAANGFAQTIRGATSTAFPWPALDIASEVADSALSASDAMLRELRMEPVND